MDEELQKKIDQVFDGYRLLNEYNYCKTCHGHRPDYSLPCLNCGEVD